MAFVKNGAVHIPLQLSAGRKRLFAIIDEDDFAEVSRHKWLGIPGGKTIYVHATSTAYLASHRRTLQAFIMKADIGQMFDHKDGNGLNNRKKNLRPATSQQNSFNTFKSHGTSSKFKGVSLTDSGRWKATIKLDGEQSHLGLFDSEVVAAKAYDQAAIKLFGEFAKTNRIMGLFNSDVANRNKSGFDVQDVRDLGTFIDVAPSASRVVQGHVVGVALHKRKHGVYLYRLSNGRCVHMSTYLGKHPTPMEIERMKRDLVADRLTKALRGVEQPGSSSAS